MTPITIGSKHCNKSELAGNICTANNMAKAVEEAKAKGKTISLICSFTE